MHHIRYAISDGGVLGGRDIAPALQRARESGKPSLINVWVDTDAYAPGARNQTTYK